MEMTKQKMFNFGDMLNSEDVSFDVEIPKENFHVFFIFVY